MDHGPAVQFGPDNAIKYKSKLGVILFFVYASIYGLFVALNTINPVIMETEIFLGLNLAIVYGFGLIIFAIVLGLFYNYFCTKKENELNKDAGGGVK